MAPLLQRTRVQFPAPTRQLITIIYCSSRGSTPISGFAGTRLACDLHTYMQAKHTNKKEK